MRIGSSLTLKRRSCSTIRIRTAPKAGRDAVAKGNQSVAGPNVKTYKRIPCDLSL
jgi:hypothetical protein